MILVNEYEAHSSGGKFIFRFDDNQQYWVDKVGKDAIREICNRMACDIMWLGVKVDEYIYQSKIEHDTLNRLELLMKDKSMIVRGRYYHDEIPETNKTFTYYPYTPYYTLEKVWMDFSEKVSILIRGEDLITEFALYEYFVDLLGLPRVRHVYLPRLHSQTELSNLSKTAGNYKISDLRDKGFTPAQVRHIIAKACLCDPRGPWSISNIKTDPKLVEADVNKILSSKDVSK